MAIQPHALYQALHEDLEPYLRSDPFDTEVSFAAHALVGSFFKKFQDDIDLGRAEANAFSKFALLNESMRTFKVELNTSLDEVLWNTFRGELHSFFYKALDSNRTWWTIDECFTLGRSGPGASIAARGSDFYTKHFDSPLSCTNPILLEHYSSSLTSYPVWGLAESTRNQRYGSVQVKGNTLSFVPKTKDVSRTICTEPSLNMFYQLGLGCILEKELKRQYGIDLKNQAEFNRDLCFRASLDESFCTIDLESASDTIHPSLIKGICPPFEGLVNLFRSSTSRFGEQIIPLHMVSTMGNGFTFPLQTLLFTCAALAVLNSYGVKPKFRGTGINLGVFGDDIILPNFMFERMTHFLRLLGFRPNLGKSFNRGNFRESCGYDYFRGHIVRGVYIRSLRTQADRYSAINRLNRWSILHKIPLIKTLNLLSQAVAFRPVPLYEDDTAGVHLPLCLVTRRRYAENQSFVYRRWESIPSRLTVFDDRIKAPKRGKKRAFNYEGLLHCFLQGSLRGMKVIVRNDRPLYTAKWKLTPNWDYFPRERYYFSSVDWSDLVCYSWMNLETRVGPISSWSTVIG